MERNEENKDGDILGTNFPKEGCFCQLGWLRSENSCAEMSGEGGSRWAMDSDATEDDRCLSNGERAKMDGWPECGTAAVDRIMMNRMKSAA